MTTKLNFIKSINEVIEVVQLSVKSTLGPTGKNAIISTKTGVKIIDDGAAIMKELCFSNTLKNHIFLLIKQASLRTDKLVGDGTTTTVLLTCSLLSESIRLINSGVKSVFLVSGIKKLTNFLLQKIKQFSFPITNKDEIFGILKTTMGIIPLNFTNELYEALLKKGKYGSLILEEQYREDDSINLQVFEGIQFDKGLVSPYFIKDPLNPSIFLQNPYVLISPEEISSVQQIQKVVEFIKTSKQSLVIIAPGYNKNLISTLIINNINNNFIIIPIKAPFFGVKQKEFLKDLSIVSASYLFSPLEFSEDFIFDINHLGRIKSAKISRSDTSIILLSSSKINLQRHLKTLRRELEVNDGVYERDLLRQRINILSGGIVKIYLASSNRAESSHLKYKVEDGINSLTTSFQEGGIISSSSLFLHLLEFLQIWSTANLINDEIFSFYIFKKAFLDHFKQLCFNTNQLAPIITNDVLKKGYPFGFDFQDLNIVNMRTSKLILDSSKMLRIVIQNSISVSTALILSL